jgi:hypothetical protein
MGWVGNNARMRECGNVGLMDNFMMRAMKKQIDNLSVDLCVFSVNLCVIPRRANGER